MNKYSKLLLILSVIFLVMMSILFSYSHFNHIYTQEKIAENKQLKQKIAAEEAQWNQLKEEHFQIDQEFNVHSQEFRDKYGYEFDAEPEKEFQKMIAQLQRENEEYLKKMRSLVINYSKYYSGEIYDFEELDGILGNYIQLTNFSNAEKLKDIPEELKIFELIDKSDGTINYLRSLNPQTRKLDVLLFYCLMYSRNLNLVTKSEKIPPFELYRDIKNLQSLYEYMEAEGFSVGDLKAVNLKYLEDNFNGLMEEYYKNMGIIHALEKEENGEK